MKCERCYQHNPEGRERCWNCGAPLQPTPSDDASKLDAEGVPKGAPQQPAASDDTSDLGTLGPLRVGDRALRPSYPVVSRVPVERGMAAQSFSRFMARGITAGALTGGAALAAVFGVLASTAGGLLEAGGVSRGATLFVLIAQAFIMGAVNGAIIGAMSSYYGGGMWTGAVVGAALSAGMWLAQTVFTGTILAMPASVAVATLLVLGLAGAAMGAFVGAVVESVSPHRD